MIESPKIVSINLGNFGSTGHIAHDVLKEAENRGYIVYNAFPRDAKECSLEENDIIISSNISKKISQRFCRYIGYNGCAAYFSTKRLIRKLEKIDPQILHLHNLHDSYINLPALFNYIKRKNISIVWTLHDCWSFTGQCPYFTLVKCEKWKKGCGDCPQYKRYPKSLYDNTRKMFKLKKKWFTGVKNMTIVTPSQWLADLAKQSYLKEYPIRVINNGIDLNIFKPTENDFCAKYNISNDKFVILGVAFGWDVRKGQDVFAKIYDRLEREKFQIVLVGVDSSKKSMLPDGIITVDQTSSQAELAEIYSAADLFVNPTREENYPTVNMESIACGTPVLTFRTGGSPEIVNEKTGRVVDCDDVESLYKEIINIAETRCFKKIDFVSRREFFDKKTKYQAYVDLFDLIMKGKNFDE